MRQQAWTREEEDLLRRVYPRLGYRCVSLFPSRSKVSVTRKAEAMGLKVDSSAQARSDRFHDAVAV